MVSLTGISVSFSNHDLVEPAPGTIGAKKAVPRVKKVDKVPEASDTEEEVAPKPSKKQKTTAKKAPAAKAPTAKTHRAPATMRVSRVKEVAKPIPEEMNDDENAMDVDTPMAEAPPPAWAVGLQNTLIGLHGKADNASTRFDDMKDTIDKNSNDIEALGTRFNEMDVKSDNQATKFTKQATVIATNVGAGFKELSGQLKETQDTILQHSLGIAKNEQEINKTKKRVDTISKEVKELATKFNDLLEQAYPRDRGDTQHEELKEILGNLAGTCVDTEDRTKTNFKTILKKIDDLMRMVRLIEGRTRVPVQEEQEDRNEDRDDDQGSDRSMGSEHEGEGDTDDSDGGSDSDDSGNGRSGCSTAWNNIMIEYHNGTTSHGQEEIVDQESAEEQPREELRTSHTAVPDESTRGGRHSPSRPNIDRAMNEEDVVDYGDSTIFEIPYTGERRGYQNDVYAAHIAAPKQVSQVPVPISRCILTFPG